MPRTRVFLVPGFFGFTHFGDFRYWMHVRDHLLVAMAARRTRPEIHHVPTLPTASLARRAVVLLETITDVADEDDSLILIGHSTGGLDARLLTTPGVRLPTELPVERWASRVRSVVSVSTPHFGAPTAAFFTGLQGQKLLRTISALTVELIRFGTVPLPALVALAGVLPSRESLGLGRGAAGVLDQVYQLVLKDFQPDRRREIETYFREATGDQTLLLQLTPEAMLLFEALAPPREGTRYGSVITRSPDPSLRGVFRTGARPLEQAKYALYRGLHLLARGTPEDVLPPLALQQREALVRAYGGLPSPNDSDGMVPTRSQVWGAVLHACKADHLDVIGHFHDPEHHPSHTDWLRSGSGFDRSAFERLWDDVAIFVTPGGGVPPPAS